ncbi:hypothetical protein RTG_01822 [Rhodotorula toruloides ATCC 204091]|uniref:Uncharacterized protein n=1 Tax=Rhodotorula toruloides TaxID=5286 RepID=A0A0K3CJS8_RHOTO|nr:hypothetical protein RTG_01822 [Rhodotorula toruloides ATCC 204091]KAK4330018.1 hypothetical protein RTBOTA2_005345 [Rhodotorula toruloides]PRQ71906.1 hypothetical protein AAT19DRAFT_10021 [Rhodotorula toruloides]
MSFSPRPRPNTVNLPFSDADVTDTYRDERSSVTASSPRRRHPRGDTPLSRRTGGADNTATSPGRWSASRRSASETDGREEEEYRADSRRERSNLDKLLDFLDQDDAEQTLRDGMEPMGRPQAMSTPPPTIPRPGDYDYPHPADPAILHPDLLAHSSHPYPAFSPTTAASFSPSLHAPPHTLRLPLTTRPLSALELLQRANGFPASRGRGAPDSPSPRPGSVAALRLSEAEKSRFVEGRNGGEDQEEGGSAASARRRRGSAGTDASLDSIARVAEATLHEFDTIVSRQAVADSTGRPASRLRDIPSPPRTASPPASQPAASHPHYRAFVHESAQDVNVQLIQELREAQDYIAYLQQELRSINEVVVQLRDRPADVPQPPRHEQETASAQAAFEVIKHTFAMLPSLPPSVSSPSPQLDSISRALTFTRSIDRLAHQTARERRDDDVFAMENLQDVLEEVERWEREARQAEQG